VRSPLPGARKLERVPLSPPLRLRRDIVDLLMEERLLQAKLEARMIKLIRDR